MHHVVNRGVDRQDVFDTSEDRGHFELLLQRALERYDIEIHAYAWMSNHFHALMYDSSGGGLRDGMRYVQGRYAQFFNKQVNRTGPLWEPRFWSKPVQDDGQLLQTVRYIHRNPLEIAGTTGLANYPYSSLGTYCGTRAHPSWLTTRRLAPLLDPERHLRFVLKPQRSDRIPLAFLPPLHPTSLEEIDQAVHVTITDDFREDSCSEMLRITMSVGLRAAAPAMMSAHFGLPTELIRSVAAAGRRRVQREPGFASWQRRAFRALPRQTQADRPEMPQTSEN